jgi:2-dehydro-3-deoxyphosphogluconate aldolase/(4S)-4-hydroxy-2-oxoglutarate aldolase
MNEVLQQIGKVKLVPVVKIENPEDAVPLGRALLDGGLPVAEITFRTDAAEEAIIRLKKELPDLFVGAGTVLTVDQIVKAKNAGAAFIVTPGFNPRIVDYCVEHDIPITPGVNSPTLVEMALEKGIEVVKFFPAEVSGGLKMIKALSGPYGSVKYVPTGGIGPSNLKEYLSFPKVLACGGSWMVKSDLIAQGKFNEITRLTREAVEIVKTI